MQDSLIYFNNLTSPVRTQQDTSTVPYESAAYTVQEYSVQYLNSLSEGNPGNVNSGPEGYIDFYKGHELRTVEITPHEIVNTYQDWFFPVFIFVLSIYTWLRMFYSKYFNQLLQAFLNTNLTNQIVRDENILVQRASILLALNFNMIAALFLYLLSLETGWSLGGIGMGFNRYVFFFTIVSAVYTFKFLILKIIGWLFDLDREMATYIFNIFLINNVLGLILVPITALMAYSPSIEGHFLADISLWIIGIAFFYRLIRGMLSGITVTGFSPIYLFLYLCTLEIAPLLVLIRIVNP
ncbi:MAG TPA: DUF4271 domain-containing protein [Bacteroidia bacterium]|nr:DUF4271 domain-containing protein [Bacteroidia bacterium]HNS12815.1 DUF4271 domain-containing protein [Bacteroidia bacterium]